MSRQRINSTIKPGRTVVRLFRRVNLRHDDVLDGIPREENKKVREEKERKKEWKKMGERGKGNENGETGGRKELESVACVRFKGEEAREVESAWSECVTLIASPPTVA